MDQSPRAPVPDRNPRPSAQSQRTAPPDHPADLLDADLLGVRVWFGRHLVCEYADTSDLAKQYAEAMGRRFLGVKVTVEVAGAHGRRPPRLPAERMWELVPR